MNDNNRVTSRFSDPTAAIDHVRRVARDTAAESGYPAAADALMELRLDYRVMPLKRRETPPDRLATWDAVRLETRSLVSMAMGGTNDHAMFDARAATPADQPLPHQPDWAPDPPVAVQAAALRAPGAAAPQGRPSNGPVVDQAPSC